MIFTKLFASLLVSEARALTETETFDLSSVITAWDNELPTLVYHGVDENCEIDIVRLVIDNIESVGDAAGKDLYAECLVVGSKGNGEKYTSMFESLPKQTADYCKQVQNHPVFGKSDFNILAMSQGGLASRHMIQDCDLGQFKVRNYLSVGGPQYGCEDPGACVNGGVWCNVFNYIQDNLNQLSILQDHLAPANYLYLPDPKYYDAMIAGEIYLPIINNMKQHSKFDQYKQRFSALNRVQFVLFELDTVVNPKISTHFGTRDFQGNELGLTETAIYKNNTIGLSDLNDAGKLSLLNIPNKGHLDFSKSDVLNSFIPFLFQKDWKK